MSRTHVVFRAPRAILLGAVAAGLLLGATARGDPPLQRDLQSYFVFGMTHVHLKNMRLLSACNSGVNCAQPSAQSECGVIAHENPFYAEGSQIAGDVARFTKPGGSIWQLFRNDNSPLDNVKIGLPGPKPDGSNALSPLPILADLDQNGQASCATGCRPDYGDLEAACGFPSPFPTCDPTKPVTATVNADCAGDTTPGNKQCDLAPGVYGMLSIRNDATVQLSAGSYTFCGILGGRRVKLLGSRAVIDVPDGGHVDIGNDSTVGENCGDVRLLLQGPGQVLFGRHSGINARVCAPQSIVKLGHGNSLRGQFVGDVVDADDGDTGECCPGRCACFDAFAPMQASVGQTVTLTSGCDESATTAVRICDKPATFTIVSTSRIDVIVPDGISGQCTIAIDSPAGTFVHVEKLTVS